MIHIPDAIWLEVGRLFKNAISWNEVGDNLFRFQHCVLVADIGKFREGELINTILLDLTNCQITLQMSRSESYCYALSFQIGGPVPRVGTPEWKEMVRAQDRVLDMIRVEVGDDELHKYAYLASRLVRVRRCVDCIEAMNWIYSQIKKGSDVLEDEDDLMEGYHLL